MSDQGPETIGEAIADLENRLFVGRRAELEVFERWLRSTDVLPAVLHVHGRGGVGKSALLRAMRVTAPRHGRTVLYVDGQAIAPNPRAFLQALTGGSAGVLEQIHAGRPLVMVDALDQLVDLLPYLRS